nr:uncharacterized protein LOC105329369 isoform X2 [Crassostrea gigas]
MNYFAEASHLQVKTNNLEPSTNTPFEENVNSTPPDDVSETFQNTSTQKNPGMQIVHLAACTDEIAEENSEAELDDLEKLHYKMQEETYTDSDQKSSSTRDDSAAYLTSETSTTKFKNKASDAAQMGFPHSMGQKTSNNPECLTKASFVEAINNNFAQPANTSLEENVKDITHDGVLKTSQNTSTRDTSKNSKSFAETSHPGMQTVHLAVCTDEITEEKFEAELDNLERLCYKMLEETNTDSDPKSSSTRDDSAAYLTSDLSTTKFENKASDAAHRDLLHSNGQNTSNHPECLRKASFVEAINNNFAPSTHTSVHENFKDITSDDVLKTSQHTSTRDTLENSKSSAETSHPGMQTVHIAVCSDEIAEEKFEAELDNLEKLRYKTPEETNTDSDPKSSSTRDDSAANLTSDTSTTKFENKALDGTQRDLPHSMGQNTSNNPECLRKALFVEAINNNFAPPANTSVGVNFKDITSDDVLKTSQHTSTRDTIENSKSSAETSHPGMQTVQLAVCTDEIAEEKSEAELNSLEKLRYKMPEETNTDSDPKSSLTRDDSAAYLTSDTSTTKFENKTSDTAHRDLLHSNGQNTSSNNPECLTKASLVEAINNNFVPSTHTSVHENFKDITSDDVLKSSQHTSTRDTIENSKSSAETFHPGMQTVQLAVCTDEIAERKKFEAELDNLEKIQYKLTEETNTDSDPKSSSTRDDSAAYLTSDTSTTKFENKASNAAQRDLPHSMGQNTFNKAECLTKASHVGAINNNFAPPANTSLEENVKDITSDDVLKISQNKSTRDPSENSKSSAETSHPGMQTVHSAVCTDEIAEQKSEAELDDLQKLSYKLTEETNTDSDPKSSSTRDDSAAYLTSDTSITKFENKASDGAQRDLLHSMGQNTFNNAECLTKASHVEAINNNFAPSTHTLVHENFKDVPPDNVLKTSQNTSTRDTLENSKSSAETFHPGMQTVHSAVCREEKSEAELDNLERLCYKMPEETNTDSDPKSSSTRDDSAAYLTSDTSTTKFENKASDAAHRDLWNSNGQNTFNNPDCLTRASHVEAINNNFAPPANTSLEENVKDITSDDVLKTSQNTSTRDPSENLKSSAKTSHPGMQTVHSAVCTDEIAEEKSEAELDNLQKLSYKLTEETNTDSDPKSSSTRDDSAAYLTSDTSMTKFENKASDGAQRDLPHSMGQNTFNNPECLTKASHVGAINNNFAPSTHTLVHENFKDVPPDNVLKTSQNASMRDTLKNSKSSAETFHPGMQTGHSAVCTDEIAEQKSEAELDDLEKMRYKLTEETNTDSDPKSSSTRDDSAAYLTSDTSTTKFENKASDCAQRDLPHSMGQNTFNHPECLTKASHVGAINNNFAPPANTSLEENVKDITSDDVLKISQNKSTRDPSENSKSSAKTSHPGMQTVHSAVCTDEIAEQKSEAELDDLQKLSYKLTEETNTDSDPKSSSTRDDSAAYLTSDTSTTKFENTASDAAQRDLPHSMGQNTSNNPECLTKASDVETINNNFAPSTHTSVDENVKDIPVNVLKTSQNTLIGDTLENSKSSAETSNSGMQTVHSAVCTDEIEEKSMEKLDHLNENQDDVLEETYYDLNSKSKQSSQDIREPSEIIPHDLKHNIPEAMTHDNYVVDDDKIKPSGTTDNTYIENFAKKSIRTTKEGSLNGFLIITAVLMLVQSLTAVIIYVILTYNMKQQYDELEITLFNRLTGDHNKMSILLNKDGTDAKEPLDEKRIKQIETEIEITRNYTKHILEPRIGEEDEKIIKILKDLQSQLQGRLNELQVQINTLRNYYKALEGKDLKMENIILSIEEFVRKEIYDISLYIVVLLFVAVIVVFRVVYDKLKPKQLRAADSTCTVPADVSNGQSLMSGPKQKFSKVDQFSSDLIKKLLQKSKEKGVGIVSFNLSTQENHWRCFKALDIPSSLSVKAYVILKLDDLMLVQPYMQMVIFIDSNERNIILENSETEIGDIRRRTTEVLLEVGCNVFVVYYSDKNSKSLPKENLYNTSLYSINNHTVLSRLRSRGRVFSVYDTFHPQQVQMLKNCLT